MFVCRLAKEVQKRTPNCPAKARKMGLKANNMSAPFKQVYNLRYMYMYSVIYRNKLICFLGKIVRIKYRRFDNAWQT